MNTASAKLKKVMRKIVRSYDFPAECLSSTPLVEVKGVEEATVSGVVRVIDYTLDEILIDACEFYVRICGEKLTLYSLDRDKLCISGSIRNVSFEEARRK